LIHAQIVEGATEFIQKRADLAHRFCGRASMSTESKQESVVAIMLSLRTIPLRLDNTNLLVVHE
jgi:hypothetical protein